MKHNILLLLCLAIGLASLVWFADTLPAWSILFGLFGLFGAFFGALFVYESKKRSNYD